MKKKKGNSSSEEEIVLLNALKLKSKKIETYSY